MHIDRETLKAKLTSPAVVQSVPAWHRHASFFAVSRWNKLEKFRPRGLALLRNVTVFF
jgi:hypothetical protein